METITKPGYATPEVVIFEVKTEGIVCQSGGLKNYKHQDALSW